MIKKMYYDLIPLIIFITMFAYVLGVYFNLFDIPFLYQITTSTGAKMWHFDTISYLRNIDGAFNSLKELKITPNPREWIDSNASFLESEFWEAILNNMAFLFNQFLWFLNVILFVFRFAAYISTNILAILGMVNNTLDWKNPQTGLISRYEPNWLMQIMTFIAQNLEIPYV